VSYNINPVAPYLPCKPPVIPPAGIDVFKPLSVVGALAVPSPAMGAYGGVNLFQNYAAFAPAGALYLIPQIVSLDPVPPLSDSSVQAFFSSNYLNVFIVNMRWQNYTSSVYVGTEFNAQVKLYFY